MNEREVLRRIEAWTGHRPYRPAMSWARLFLGLFVLALVLLFLSGCTIETVTTRETSAKGAVVETVRTTKKTDPAAWALAGDVVAAYSPPRARVIRQEKSAVTPGDVRRILRGPIQPREIALRWRPAAP